MNNWIGLIIGSVAGGVSRYLVTVGVSRFVGQGLIYGTLIVNLVGCFILGFLMIAFEQKFAVSPHLRLLLVVGFCGSFTTFSTFIMEIVQLMDTGHVLKAGGYLGGSIIFGTLCLYLGTLLGKAV